LEAAVRGGQGRLRAVMMTAMAMLGGMLPVAMGAEQTAPLGRAVMGGLVLATFATLTVVPALYAILQSSAGAHGRSLDPTDPTSRHYDPS
jgi:multidrug efflux pump subunit AcrB